MQRKKIYVKIGILFNTTHSSLHCNRWTQTMYAYLLMHLQAKKKAIKTNSQIWIVFESIEKRKKFYGFMQYSKIIGDLF